MKKIFAILFVVFCLTGAAPAKEASSDGYISVKTEAAEDLSPTTVKISFAVENSAKEPQEASELNKKTSKELIEALKKFIDSSKGEDIKTISYRLNPQYSYKDGSRKQTGYLASNTLQVTLKDTEKAGKLIAAALSSGANSVSGLQFLLDDTGESCNKLIQQAAKDAKLRANSIAEAMGVSVAGIKSINAGCSSSSSFQSNFRALNSKAGETTDAALESVPVEAGKNQLKAFVNAEFFVK